jgi:hypothetical protein
LTFQLFTLITDNPLLEDPYCAINVDGTRLLMISEDMIRLELPMDQLECEKLFKDYIPTSRHIDYDLPALEKLILNYTKQPNFYFAALFAKEFRQVGLAFAKPPHWKHWHEYIDATHESPIAQKIIQEVFTNMVLLREQVFHVM